MSKEELEAAVLSLPREERASLAHKLIVSIDEGEGDATDLSGEWRQEIRRRVEEIQRGDVHLVPGEEVFGKLRARLGRSETV
jgi:putative addiction module component (TIGR02574 family)